MDKLVDQLFIFEGSGEVKGFIGSYVDYREIKAEGERRERAQQQKEKKEKVIEEKSKEVKEKKKLSFKEKHEYEQLEKEIPELEKEKSELEAALNDSSTDYEKLQELTERLGKVMTLIDEKTERWMELDEFAQ